MRTETLIESEYDELGKPTVSIDKTENIVYNYRCNGTAITYDDVGNPPLYRGHTLGWSRIRLLASWDSLSFAYNANGIRTRKGDTSYHI